MENSTDNSPIEQRLFLMREEAGLPSVINELSRFTGRRKIVSETRNVCVGGVELKIHIWDAGKIKRAVIVEQDKRFISWQACKQNEGSTDNTLESLLDSLQQVLLETKNT